MNRGTDVWAMRCSMCFSMRDGYDGWRVGTAWRKALCLIMLALAVPAGLAKTIVAEDWGVDEFSELDGHRLVLNGVAEFKLGAVKAGAVALYLPERKSDLDAIFKLDRPIRVRLHVQRELSASTVSRMYLADFKQNASEDEFKKIVTAVGQIGAAYANIKGVSKGDVVNMDWVPGKGFSASIGGKPVCAEPNVPLVIKDALAFEIQLRRYLGPKAPESVRQGLLGL